MRKLISFILLLLLNVAGPVPAAAQYFNKRYTLYSGGNVFTNAIEGHGKIYAINVCNDSVNYVGSGFFRATNGFKFVILDSAGNVLSTKLYQYPDKLFNSTSISNNIKRLADGTFLFALSSIDTTLTTYNPTYLETHTALVHFDSIGNLLKYTEFKREYCLPTDATDHVLSDFQIDAFGNHLILASTICNGQAVCYLHKMNKDLNTIWVKYFKVKASDNLPRKLLIENDGYVMTGGVRNGNLTPFPNYYTSFLIKCDTGGTQLWSWQNYFSKDSLQFIVNDVIRTKDRAYVYCGTGNGEPTYFSGKKDWSGIIAKGMVQKLDSNRNILWSTLLSDFNTAPDYVDQTVLRELPDGNILVAGSAPQLLDTADKTKGWIRGSLAKLDGKDGHVIWRRYYKSPDDNDTMRLSFYDMRATSDGGYLLAGEAVNLIDRGFGPPQQGWLLKVDSNGCLGPGDPQCKPVSVREVAVNPAACQVFPNPVSEALVVHNQSPKAIYFQVQDLFGRVLIKKAIPAYSEQSVSLQDIPSALYLYQIRSDGLLIRQDKIIKQ